MVYETFLETVTSQLQEALGDSYQFMLRPLPKNNGVEGLRAGTPLYDIGYRVQTYAESFGYGVIRSYTGHGIGREMHEDPSVPNFGKQGTGVRLRAGTVICIEPMIAMGSYRTRLLDDDWGAVTVDGKPAAHYENTLVIREDGVEILTL